MALAMDISVHAIIKGATLSHLFIAMLYYLQLSFDILLQTGQKHLH